MVESSGHIIQWKWIHSRLSRRFWSWRCRRRLWNGYKWIGSHRSRFGYAIGKSEKPHPREKGICLLLEALAKEIPPIRGMSCFRQWVLRSTRPKRKGYYLLLLVGFFSLWEYLIEFSRFSEERRLLSMGQGIEVQVGKRGITIGASLEINGLVKCKADGSVDR